MDGDLAEPLVVLVEQFEVGVVVEQAERVAQRVLDERPDRLGHLLGRAGRRRPIAAGRPDLGRQQLELVGLRCQRDQLQLEARPRPARRRSRRRRVTSRSTARRPARPAARRVAPGGHAQAVVAAVAAGVEEADELLGRRRRRAAWSSRPRASGRTSSSTSSGGRPTPAGRASRRPADDDDVIRARPLQGARVERLRVARAADRPRRPLAADEQMIAGDLVMVRDAGAGPLDLAPVVTVGGQAISHLTRIGAGRRARRCSRDTRRARGGC